MNSGMMWFDNDPKTALSTKISRAVEYYHSKYGKIPNLCLVNPISLSEDEMNHLTVSIRALDVVLPGHFWIGQEDIKE